MAMSASITKVDVEEGKLERQALDGREISYASGELAASSFAYAPPFTRRQVSELSGGDPCL